MSRLGEPGYPAGNSLYPTSSAQAGDRPIGHTNEGGEGNVRYKTDPLTGRLVFLAGDNFVQPDIAAALTRANLSRAIRSPIAGEFISAAAQATFTWGLVCQIDTPFDAVRPILFHVDTNAIAGVTACAAAGPDFVNDKHGNALTWTNATFAGAASGTLPAGAAQRPSILASDFIPVSSVARTDGGSGYIAYVRVCLPTAGTAAQSLNQTADITQLTSLSAGAFYSERLAGDFTQGTKTGFGSAMPGRTDTPFWGVEFLCRGKTVSIVEFGDSITRGSTTLNPKNRNYGEVACLAQSLQKNGVTLANGNCGWGSQTTAQYLARAQDLIPVLKPTFAVFPAFSPNDHSANITQAALDAESYRAGQFVELCRANGTIPILATGTPAASNKGWNAAEDAKRVAFNAGLKAGYGKVALIFDWATAVGDGATPENLKASLTTDALHLNDAGHAAAGAEFVASVLPVIQGALA